MMLSIMNGAHMLEQEFQKNPALNWMPEFKAAAVKSDVMNDRLYTSFSSFYERQKNGKTITPAQRLKLAADICPQADLTVAPDHAVFFSGETRNQAENFVRENPHYDVIHTRPGGVMLELLSLFDPENGIDYKDAYQAWFTLAARYSETVAGNVTALVENPKPEKTFRRIELGLLMENTAVKTINHRPKETFSSLITGGATSYNHQMQCFHKVVRRYQSFVRPNTIKPVFK